MTGLKIKDRLSTSAFIQKYLKLAQVPLYVKPKLVTFDAYNTLYATKKPVLDLYVDQYNKVICSNSQDQISLSTLSTMNEHFVQIFKTHMTTHPNYGKYTNITPTNWWVLLIQSIFKDVDRELTDSQAKVILKQFEGEVYDTFPDIRLLLKTIHGKSKIGICSNTDPMFYNIINHMKLKYKEDFVLPDKDYEFLSFYLDKKKDSTGEFFNDVYKKIANEMDKKEIWHIGDELKNDLIGSSSAGWIGICIDRGNVYGYFNTESNHNNVSNEVITLEKINKSADLVYKEGKQCDDVVLLENGSLVVRNLYTIKEIYSSLI